MIAVKILNEGWKADYEESKDGDISATLQKYMLQIRGDFMSEKGKAVNYSALKSSELFMGYVKECSRLTGIKLEAFAEEERMAFFINIYNALTIHGICEEGVPTSVLEVKKFWKSVAYSIGGYVFTLDDIEHGILRGNRPHPSGPELLFSETDPRLQFSMSNFDPRIHFALVCGAKSCPAINIYSAKNLQHGLKAATTNFCSQEIQVDLQMHQVKLSKIFLWYKTDFGNSDTEILRWILFYLSDQAHHDLKQLLNDSEKAKYTLSAYYTDYDWKLNSISANL